MVKFFNSFMLCIMSLMIFCMPVLARSRYYRHHRSSTSIIIELVFGIILVSLALIKGRRN